MSHALPPQNTGKGPLPRGQNAEDFKTFAVEAFNPPVLFEVKRTEVIVPAPPFVSREEASALFEVALGTGKLLDPFLDRPGTFFELKPASGDLDFTPGVLASDAFLRAYKLSSLCTASGPQKLSLRAWQHLLEEREGRDTLLHILRHEIRKSTAFLYGKARKSSSWQDVLQEVRIAIDKLWHEYNPEKGSLISFVRDRLKNRVYDAWRSESTLSRANQKRKKELEEKGIDPFSSEAEEDSSIIKNRKHFRAAIRLDRPASISGSHCDNDQSLELPAGSLSDPSLALQVEELLAMLPLREAKALQLTFLDGRSGKESAAIFGISGSAFTRIKQNALKWLGGSEALESREEGDDSLDFSIFEREISIVSERSPVFSSFEPYIRGLDSIDDLFRSKVPAVGRFRSALLGCDKPGSLEELSEEGRKVALFAIRKDFPTIDEVKKDPMLCRLLGLETRDTRTKEIVRKCLELGIHSPERPAFQAVVNSSIRQSFYFDPTLVGEKTAKANILAAAKETFPSLHAVNTNIASFRIFCSHFCQEQDFTLKELQKQLVFLGWSRSLPENLQQLRARHSVYFDHTVVGQNFARENRVKALRSLFPSLHKVKSSGVISAPLHSMLFESEKRLTVSQIQTYLSKKNKFFARIPRGSFSLTPQHMCYFDPEIAGRLVLPNLKRYLRNNVKNLDDLRASDRMLARAMSLKFDKKAPEAPVIAREAIKLGVSPHLPPGHYFSKDRIISFYFEADIVGEEVARKNLHEYLRSEFKSLDDVSSTGMPLKAICDRLGIPARATELAHYMVSNELIPPTIPDGHNGTHCGKGVTFYLNPSVIKSSSQRKANLIKFVRENCPNLDEISISRDLWQPLGLGKKLEEVATTIARWVEREIPPQQPLAYGRSLTFHVNPRVVGLSTARDNLFKWIVKNATTVQANMARPPQALGRALNMTKKEGETEVKVPGGKHEYLKALAERGLELFFDESSQD